jgi:hypothetical protein
VVSGVAAVASGARTGAARNSGELAAGLGGVVAPWGVAGAALGGVVAP